MSKVAAVLIVKNEESCLEKCLDSLKGVDELIICDTGSTDRTLEIAKRYTNKLTHFAWCDNFAKARNHAKSLATADWILSIDADEWLHDLQAVRDAIEIAEKRGTLAVNVKMIAEDNGQSFGFPRLFKNSPQVWWEGAVHNHLSVAGEDIGSVAITHGWSMAHMQDMNRALRILEKEAQENPTPRTYYYLGREYWYRLDYANCVQVLGKYVQLSSFPGEKADAFLLMARCYWAMKMADDARDACAQALIINANFREAILFMAELAGKGSGNPRWEANAHQWLRMAETATNANVLFIRNEV